MSLHRTSAKQYGGLNLTLLALSALSLLLSTSPLAEAARGHKLSGPYPDEPRPYNPCGYFDSDEYLDAGNAHQPCYDANMEVLYCCLSGSTMCTCPSVMPDAADPESLPESFGCYNYVSDSAFNAITGSPCGIFFPEASAHAGPGRVLATNMTTTGFIAVTKASDGTSLGFVSNTFLDLYTSNIGVTTNSSARLQITFSTGSDPFQITILNGMFSDGGAVSNRPYLGFGPGLHDFQETYDLSSNSSNFLHLIATATSTPANSGPQTDTNYATAISRKVETTVWSLMGTALTAQWVNADGPNHPASYLTYFTTGNTLGITGNPFTGTLVDFTLQTT